MAKMKSVYGIEQTWWHSGGDGAVETRVFANAQMAYDYALKEAIEYYGVGGLKIDEHPEWGYGIVDVLRPDNDDAYATFKVIHFYYHY